MSASAARLYTPEVLALAVDLGDYPLNDDLPLVGEAHSKVCGSCITMGLALNGDGAIDSAGVRISTCAIGQAATALFLRAARGKSASTIEHALQAIGAWLTEGGELPDWPGLAVLEPARAYPGRHGAILLPWKAACAALCKNAPAD